MASKETRGSSGMPKGGQALAFHNRKIAQKSRTLTSAADLPESHRFGRGGLDRFLTGYSRRFLPANE